MRDFGALRISAVAEIVLTIPTPIRKDKVGHVKESIVCIL